VIRVEDVPAQPWRNGGGRTRELLTRPAGGADWKLRISLAEVDREGPFSAFPGIERWFSVIDGAGVRLSLEGRERVLQPGHAPLYFRGESPVYCRLIEGPTTDLNLMHVPGRGLMQAVESGVAWRAALPGRGIFTRSAGRLQIADADERRLAGHCLLWLDEAADVAWTFTSDEPGSLPPALWLGYAAQTD
jgi:environmental stress-induced protein Ves